MRAMEGDQNTASGPERADQIRAVTERLAEFRSRTGMRSPLLLGVGVLVLCLTVVATLLFMLRPSFSPSALFGLDDARPVEEDARVQQDATSRTGEASGTFGGAAEGFSEGRTIALSVASAPPGATVMIDSDSIGTTPLATYSLPTGVWILSIRKPHYAPFDTVLFLEHDEELFFSLRLERGTDYRFAIQEAPVRRLPDSAPPVRSPQSPEASAFQEPLPVAAEPDFFAQEVEPPQGEGLTITSEPPGAAFWINDRFMGVTPMVVRDAPAGPQRVRFQKQGYAPYAAELEIESLESLHRILPALGAEVTILVRPRGSIYIDGELHQPSTEAAYVTYLSEGAHRIKALHPVLGTWEQVIQVTKDAPQRVMIDLDNMQAQAVAGSEASDTSSTASNASTPAASRSVEKPVDGAQNPEAWERQYHYQYFAGQGDALFNQGNYEEALKKYESMLVYRPGDPYALGKVAEVKRVLLERQPEQEERKNTAVAGEDGVYLVAEEPPKLIGGLNRLYEQIQYPRRAYNKGVQGRVYVTFIVDEEGRIEDPHIVNGIGYGCDEEVLRVVRLTRMEPGKVNGRPVKVRYTLYVTFKIDE